jgi:uncharacterized membrane protein
MRVLVRIFVTGVLAALPLAATVLVFVWAAGLLVRWLGPDSAVGRLLVSIGLGVGASEVVGYAIGVAIIAALVFGLGLLVEAGLQRGLAAVVNAVMLRIPVVRTVYDLMQRMVGLLRAQDERGDGLKSMSPVWCHFGGPKAEGSCVVLALLSSEQPVMIDGQRSLAVLVPTSPVPVGGGLLYVPEHWVTKADVGVEAVTSIYVSMGLTSPQHLPKAAESAASPASCHGSGSAGPLADGPQGHEVAPDRAKG